MLPLTVVIHTKNEELNLHRSINSVAGWVNQILVVDSDSDDRTQQIALELGADLISRKCERRDLVRQRNWALEHEVIRNEWIFVLDADEAVDKELRRELENVFAGQELNDYDAFSCRFKEIVFGRWLKHSSMYPTWTIRLLRRDVVRYEERSVNSHPVVDPGRQGRFKGHLLHEAQGGFGRFLGRMSSFAELEAAALELEHQRSFPPLGDLFRGPIPRRKVLKQTMARLPFRGTLTFIYLYVLRGGFLDGRAGLHWCTYRATFEWMIGAKRFEIDRMRKET